MLDAPGWPEELRAYSKLRTPEAWLPHAIRNKAVQLEHNSLVNFNYEGLKFNRKVYKDWPSLRDADIPNYPTSKAITEQMVSSWLAAGLIREAREEEHSKIVINPVHAVNTSKEDVAMGRKARFILHTKLNSVVKKLPTKLEGIQSSLPRLLQLKEGSVLELFHKRIEKLKNIYNLKKKSGEVTL